MTGVVNQTGARSGIVGTNVGTPSSNAADIGAGDLPVVVTGGSGLTALGTVATGTLGASVVFNAAHKDVDLGADGWSLYLGSGDIDNSTTTEQYDFGYQTVGSNCSESGGAITIGTAGWYIMFLACTVNGTESRTLNIAITRNGTAETDRIGHRNYCSVNQNGGSYRGKTVVAIHELAASDVMRVCGSGYLYGAGNSISAMNSFQGFRIGA